VRGAAAALTVHPWSIRRWPAAVNPAAAAWYGPAAMSAMTMAAAPTPTADRGHILIPFVRGKTSETGDLEPLNAPCLTGL